MRRRSPPRVPATPAPGGRGRCAGGRLASRIFSTPPTCRQATARRSTPAARAALMAVEYKPPEMPERPPRLALCRTPHWDEARPEGKAVLEDAAARLRAAGAAIVDRELPAECADISGIQSVHSNYEAPRVHA